MENDFPQITIVMPVKNEERFIADTLNHLLRQDYPADRFEILVVDGMSTDATRQIVRQFEAKYRQIRLLENPKHFSSAGRNIGFRQGTGDVFLVVDGHCYIPTDQLFRNIVSCLEKSGARCLGRPQHLDPPNISDFQISVALARGSRIGHGADSFIYSQYEGFVSPVSHGAIYTRDVFERVGYVDESFDACEDVEFNYRIEKAGIPAYMSPELTIRYYPRNSLAALFKQLARYGNGRYRLLRKHPEILSLSGSVPAFFTLGLLVLPPAGLIHPAFWALFLLLYGAYLVVAAIQSILIGRKHGMRHVPRLIPIFFTIHFALGWGFLKAVAKRC